MRLASSFRARALVAVAVAAAGLAGAGPAAARTHAAPTPPRYYFHGAGATYLDDWQADAAAAGARRAPKGDALTTVAPRGTTDRTARSTTPRFAGLPTNATFALPVSGPVASICLDVFVSSHYGPAAGALAVYLLLAPAGDTPASDPQQKQQVTPTDHANADPAYTPGQVTRVTRLLQFPPHTTLPAGAALVIGPGSPVNNYDWTLYYDSQAHPSSVTFNARSCPAAPAPKGH